MVTVHRLPNGDPFAVVIDSRAQARTAVAVDRSSVTITLRQSDKMPCSVIFPADVAEQVFGPDFAFVLPAEVSDSDAGRSGNGGPVANTGGDQ